MGSLKIKIGADPELFVREKSSGRLVSAHDLLPGTKIKPHKVTYGAVQVDGVAAEFNIQPCQTAGDFYSVIQQVTGQLQSILGEKYELVTSPVGVFNPEYFKALPKEVTELGCNPDWNAWTGQVNPKPDGDSTTMRTASGHVHIGWTDDADVTSQSHFDDCRLVARQMDYYLGIASLLWDPDNRRRSMYGKAGCFRVKPYGAEYRTMSNMWLTSAPITKWVFNAAHRAMNMIIKGETVAEDEFGDLAQKIIDNNETDWASKHKKLKYIFTNAGIPNPPIPDPDAEKIVKAVMNSLTGKQSSANHQY